MKGIEMNGEIVVTKNAAGQIVAVTRQDEEGRILSVLAESEPAAVAVPDEREAFEAKFKHLDLSRDRDAWMQEKYKHAAISLAWEAWQGRAALAATPADHIADAGKMVENVREGAPYDNPAFEHLARDLGVWGTAQSAICAQFWLAATPAAAPVDKSPEFQGSMVDKNMNLQGLEAAPVVLPEPDAAIIDIMRMVASFGEASRKNKAIELREAELFHAIETKLRALLATGGQAQAVEQEPFGYFKAEPFGWTDCGPDDEGAVALYERPQAQADARDAGRWRMASLIHSEMMKHPDIRAEPEAASAYMKAVHDGVCFEAAIDAAIAAAKGNEQ